MYWHVGLKFINCTQRKYIPRRHTKTHSVIRAQYILLCCVRQPLLPKPYIEMLCEDVPGRASQSDTGEKEEVKENVDM